MTQTNTCQSCGMPMTEKDQLGSNLDGSQNNEYCVFCFKEGKFTNDGISLGKMIEDCVSLAVKDGMDKTDAFNLATKVLPTLKRWKQD